MDEAAGEIEFDIAEVLDADPGGGAEENDDDAGEVVIGNALEE